MINKKKILKEIKSWILTFVGAFFIVALLNSKVYASAIVVLCQEKVQVKSEQTIFAKIVLT